jgi:GxxExxY protein
LETVYEVILAHELRRRGLAVERQVSIPIEYQGLKFDEGFRADLLVENKVIVELKCVERLNNAHKKQLLTYLQLTDRRPRVLA